MKQHYKLLIGFVVGVCLGLFAHYNLPQTSYPFMKFATQVFTFIGAFWLRLIFMVVVPLLVSALMMGSSIITATIRRGSEIGAMPTKEAT